MKRGRPVSPERLDSAADASTFHHRPPPSRLFAHFGLPRRRAGLVVYGNIPPGDRWVGGIDFGYRNPFAAVWGYLTPGGVLVLTNEHYSRQKPLSYHAQHLRRDLDPDMEVEVEVLDVTEDEARTLLLSIDPLAALAETQQQLRDQLQELVPDVPEELRFAWQATTHSAIESPPSPTGWAKPTIAEQYAVLVTCRDETQQIELLRRFQQEGLECKALLS